MEALKPAIRIVLLRNTAEACRQLGEMVTAVAPAIKVSCKSVNDEKLMTTIKIVRSGSSQSVQLPDGFQFDVDEVEILRRDDEVILRKKRENLRQAFELLASMPEDYFAEERRDPPPEIREAL